MNLVFFLACLVLATTAGGQPAAAIVLPIESAFYTHAPTGTGANDPSTAQVQQQEQQPQLTPQQYQSYIASFPPQAQVPIAPSVIGSVGFAPSLPPILQTAAEQEQAYLMQQRAVIQQLHQQQVQMQIVQQQYQQQQQQQQQQQIQAHAQAQPQQMQAQPQQAHPQQQAPTPQQQASSTSSSSSFTPSASSSDSCQRSFDGLDSTCMTRVPPSGAAFTASEAVRAGRQGWAFSWASQATGEALHDPLDEMVQQLATKTNDDASASASAATTTTTSPAEYSWPASFDTMFDAENSEFESAGSGWNDDAVVVETGLGPCRGQIQPGHLIYCVRPRSRVDLTVAARNTGERAWTPHTFELALHALDAAVWDDPYITPTQLDPDLFRTSAAAAAEGGDFEATQFYTQSAASDAFTHALSSQSMTLLRSTSIDGVVSSVPCVASNDTGLFGISLESPSVTGLYTLRFSPRSPCGRLARPLRVNLEVTCSDGRFCNGFERQSADGSCETPVSDMTRACDDHDSCTVDACDETLGKCSYKLINSSECRSAVCGGERCDRMCAAGAQCGADGCGGLCGMCQTEETCVVDRCLPSATLAGGCFHPAPLSIFQNDKDETAWRQDPASFTRGSMDDSHSASSSVADAADRRPSELSRQFLRITDIDDGGDEVTPTCVSFGTRPDFIWRFVVPENSFVNASSDPSSMTPLQVNLAPLEQSALRRVGYVGLDVQAYGRYNPRIDTVVEVRGAPGFFASTSDDLTVNNLRVGGVLDPIYTCLEDRRALNGTMVGPDSHHFILHDSSLEQARSWAVGQSPGAGGDAADKRRLLRPFSMCNDNNTPPGGVGSQLSVLLPPGTYYLVISSYPRFNIPPSVQALHDAAAPPPAFELTDAQAREVEAFVRFTSGYLPDCANQACGDDGGGNACGGGCPTGTECHTDTGRCARTQCTPDCVGRTCGSDGCGGSCGTCTLGSFAAGVVESTPNPLGVPLAQEDVYCVESRDPSLDMSNPNASIAGTRAPLGPASCALLPRTCDGARPICYGLAKSDGSLGGGCPTGTFCANDCRCLALATPLPDLLVKFDALVGQISLTSYAFSNRSCSLVEKCIARPGLRKLLRFSVAIVNQGAADLVLPRPREQPDEFLYSPCHHHYHYHHFADYSLIQSGRVRQRGHKQAFCLEDSMQEQVGADVPCLAHHTCTQPGIQRGWSDYYGADLDCQWIDVSDLPPGKYLLRVEVNSARSLLESTFENNVLVLEVTIPHAADVKPQ